MSLEDLRCGHTGPVPPSSVTTLLLVAFVFSAFLSSSAAGMSVGLYWDEAATADSLVVTASSTVRGYLVIEEDGEGAGFVGFYGGIYVTSGVSIRSVECVGDMPGRTSLDPSGDSGLFLMTAYYDDCIPFQGHLTIAQLDFDVDPALFSPVGDAVIGFISGGSTDYETAVMISTYGCVQYAYVPWNVSGARVIDAAVPVDELSFGALKAMYR